MAVDEGPFMRIRDLEPWISDRTYSVKVFASGSLNPPQANCVFGFSCSPAVITSNEFEDSLTNDERQSIGYTDVVSGRLGGGAFRDGVWENGDSWSTTEFSLQTKTKSVGAETFPCLGGGSKSVDARAVGASVLQSGRPPEFGLAPGDEYYDDIVFEVLGPKLFDKTCVQSGQEGTLDPDQGGESTWKYKENELEGTGLTLSAKELVESKGIIGRQFFDQGRWWRFVGIVGRKNFIKSGVAGDFDILALEIADPTTT